VGFRLCFQMSKDAIDNQQLRGQQQQQRPSDIKLHLASFIFHHHACSHLL